MQQKIEKYFACFLDFTNWQDIPYDCNKTCGGGFLRQTRYEIKTGLKEYQNGTTPCNTHCCGRYTCTYYLISFPRYYQHE